MDPKMIDFRLDLPYPTTADGEPGRVIPTTGHATRLCLLEAVSSRFPQGVEGTDRKIWGRLDRLVAKALENGQEPVIRINDTQFEFLVETVKVWKVRPTLAAWWSVLEEYLNGLRDTGKS